MLARNSESKADAETGASSALGTPQLRIVRLDDAEECPPHRLQSPSLEPRQFSAAPACEMKFLIGSGQADELQSRLQPHLALDPYAAAAEGNSYSLTTLYCDTPELDVFYRQGRYRLFKFRIRQYGRSSRIYLERKSKRGLQVRKRRTPVDSAEMTRLEQLPTRSDWSGAWYHSQLARNRFLPVCLLRYERTAYFGLQDDGPIRLTLDRNIVGGLTSLWSLEHTAEMRPLLSNAVVCELKYRGSLPAIFKAVIETMQLMPVGVSKYRHCLRASGIGNSGESSNA